jgi:hypothetical protein
MWQRRQQTVRATPVPTPVIAAVEEIPPNGSNSYGKPPVNEPPNGRVWQVDAYIRKNAAVPHSLRYKAWGPVQPHPKGYQVRVQYSLESAEDFGTSHEDMMFFMTPTGRVYQRAPVK